MDDLSAFLIGRNLGGSIAREQERRHKELIDAMEANRHGESLAQYRQRMVQEGMTAMNNLHAQNAGYYRTGGLFRKNIVEVGLKTEVDLVWGVKSLPQIGRRINANESFMHCSVGCIEMDLAIPFDGVVIACNQKAVDERASIKRLLGLWLVKIQVGPATQTPEPQKLKTYCSYCSKRISVREYGAVVLCPRCGARVKG